MRWVYFSTDDIQECVREREKEVKESDAYRTEFASHLTTDLWRDAHSGMLEVLNDHRLHLQTRAAAAHNEEQTGWEGRRKTKRKCYFKQGCVCVCVFLDKQGCYPHSQSNSSQCTSNQHNTDHTAYHSKDRQTDRQTVHHITSQHNASQHR